MTSTQAGVVDPATLAPLEVGCEWRSADLGDGYVFELTDSQVEELDAALRFSEGRCDDVLDITREDFPLRTLAPELAWIT